ncbi:MAG: helix-turn-helix transcriptional regulator [Chloroflexi bacterium]|nr:helix-turn-helix transcriptional regulator [Chloroflexota bacterium]
MLNRSQNWLAREAGVSPGYISMLVNGERTPSGRIRRRMLKALGFDGFDQLFTMEVRDDEP